MTDALEVADPLIVVPELDSLILTSRDEMLTCFSDSQGVDFTGFRTIKHSDGLSIEAVPVGDLSVAAGGKHLRFIGVVEDLLEHGGLEEAHNSSIVDDVPNDT